MRRLVVTLGLLFLVTAAPARAATLHDVGEFNSTFKNGACPSPAGNNIATVTVGDTVKWTNCDAVDHDIGWDDPTFANPPVMHQNEWVAQTFNKAGFYDYHCEIHPGMKGRVIVQPGAAAPTTKATAPPATTTTTAPTITTTTQTTVPVDPVFATTTTSLPDATTSTTEVDATPIIDKDRGANGAIVALTLVGIAAVVAGGVYVVRRMRGAASS